MWLLLNSVAVITNYEGNFAINEKFNHNKLLDKFCITISFKNLSYGNATICLLWT